MKNKKILRVGVVLLLLVGLLFTSIPSSTLAETLDLSSSDSSATPEVMAVSPESAPTPTDSTTDLVTPSSDPTVLASDSSASVPAALGDSDSTTSADSVTSGSTDGTASVPDSSAPAENGLVTETSQTLAATAASPSSDQASRLTQRQTKDVLNSSPSLISVTGATFQAIDNGTTVTDFSKMPQTANFTVSYAFNVEDMFDTNGDDGQVMAGDYFTIQLPTQLSSIAAFTAVNDQILSTTYNNNSYDVAKLSINSSGTATIVFLSDVEDLSDVSLSFTVNGTFVDSAINDGDHIAFNLLSNGAIYDITFISTTPVTPVTGASIQKIGHYDTYTNTITWNVVVNAPNSSTTLTNVKVIDTLGSNQTYNVGSSSVTAPVYDATTNTYTFDLGSVKGSKSFIYTTTPTDGAFSTLESGSSTVTNNVQLFSGEPSALRASANASVILTTDWIKKTGTLRNTNGTYYIDWTIQINNNDRVIPAGSKITDEIPSYLTLDSSTIKRNGNDPISTYHDSYAINGQSLTYTFNADTPGVQVLTFTTSVDPAYYNQQSTSTFINTATIAIGLNTYSDKTGSFSVPTHLILKTGEGYDAAAHSITWKLQVNSNQVAINNAQVSDRLQSNQVLDETYGVRLEGSTTSIPRATSQASLTTSAPQYYYNTSSRQMYIYFGNLASTDQPVVYYKTLVSSPTLYATNYTEIFQNTATITGDNIISSTSTGKQPVNSEVLAKENTGYDYQTRTLSWKITVNENNMNMPNAVVKDLIPANQSYVAGSMLIDGVAPDASVLDINGNTLTLLFGALSTQKVITFNTVVSDVGVFMTTNGSVSLKNNATLDSGISGAPTVQVEAEKNVTNTAIMKQLSTEYSPKNGYIEWAVYVNSNQVPLDNTTLSDTLQKGLELDTESVELYQWTMDSLGNNSIGTLIPSTDYSFNYDYTTRLFNLTLPNKAQGYYLKFKTDVLEAGKYSNTISFSGNYTTSSSASSNYTVSSTNILTSASGSNGSITVNKVDENGNRLTSTAQFELLDSRLNVIKTLSTNAQGSVTFSRLKYRTYYIREKSAPTGYAISAQTIKVSLTNTSSDTRNKTINFADSLLNAKITLYKTDDSNNPLSGATFALYASTDTSLSTPLATATSNVSGQIVFSGLLAGTYYIKETAAPSGYTLSSEVKTVTLLLDMTTNTLPDVIVSTPFIDTKTTTPKGNTSQDSEDSQDSSTPDSSSSEDSQSSSSQESSSTPSTDEGNQTDTTASTPTSVTKLVQSGSFFDASVLISVGVLLIAVGGCLLFRRFKPQKKD